MKLIRICGHTFVADFLGAAPVVFDCGANRGIFSERLSTDFGASVFGFEPDPRLYAALPQLERTSFFNLAVSSQAREMLLNLGVQNCSSVHFSEGAHQDAVSVRSIDLDGFCKQESISRIDLLKLDIEGAEIEVLEALSDEFLASLGQVTVEFHDFLDIAERPAIERVIDRLRNAGFDFVKFSHHDHSDCLFVNRRHHRLGFAGRMELLAKKYCRGISRRLGWS